MRSIVVAALIVIAAALFAPAASQAAAPCWQRVIGDWRDGRIDGQYAVQCYRDALSHLPEDLRVYGTAEGDIQRALTRALAHKAIQASAPARVTNAEGAVASPTTTAARASDRRTLAGHTSEQPKTRVAAAPIANTTGSSFPATLVLAAGAGLLAAAAALLLRRPIAQRLRRG
jgi:hypothetical protein